MSLAVLALVLGAASCSSSGESSSPTTTAVAAPTVDPGSPGPYAVGRSTITVNDVPRNRPLTVDVWYPAPVGTTGTPSRYSFLPTAYYDSKLALADPPAATGGPFPLVVYSHGAGGVRFISAFLAEHLASQGFVVVAADHIGDSALEAVLDTTVPADQNDIDRPQDVTAMLDGVLAAANGQLASAPAQLTGLVEPSTIGFIGHSYGGYTGFAMVSGRTTAYGTSALDNRIDTVIGLAPFTRRLTDEELSRVDVPTLVMVGTKDTTTPVDTDSTRPFDQVPGRPFEKVELVDAVHQSFSDLCLYQTLLPTLPDVPAALSGYITEFGGGACAPEAMAIGRAQEVTNTMASGWLFSVLLGRPGYEAYVNGDWARTQPDLVVETKS